MTDATVLTRLLHAIDARDWDRVRTAFAAEFHTDYTSLWGGEPETLTPEVIVARWTELLQQFGATQHLIGPPIVDGDHIETHVIAHHWQAPADGGQAWTVYGHYLARVIDGKITSLTLQTFRAEGNPDLPSITSIAH